MRNPENGSAANPLISEEIAQDEAGRRLWERFLASDGSGRARVGRPRKGSERVTWRQLGVSKRLAHTIRTLGRLGRDEAEIVAQRQMSFRKAEALVHGPRRQRNPLFAAWDRATGSERRAFLDVLDEARRQAQFFAERESES
jgi:hypothetical protein